MTDDNKIPTAITLNEALRHHATSSPSRTFIHHRNDSYSYSDVYQEALSFASYLTGIGVRPGDKVAMALPRKPELVICFLACSLMGAHASPVNHLLSRNEVNTVIRRIRPKAVVVGDLSLDQLDETTIEDLGLHIIVTGERKHRYVSWSDTISVADDCDLPEIGADDVAYLNYTTGSTGIPKGALTTHSNIYWNTMSAIEAFEITGDDIHLCMFASFAHPHELFSRALYTGGGLIMLEEISPKAVALAVKDNSVTCIMGLAPMYETLNRRGSTLKLKSLRIAESGGMYTRPEINAAFMDNFGVPILSVWGSTETTGISVGNRPDSFRMDGSMGRALPHYEIRVVGGSGEDLPDGETGEMAVRGKGVVSGYVGMEPLPLLEGGWRLTGDMVRRDENGFLYFADRKSGMVKIAGLKVFPAQLETALLELEGVSEAAVIGVTDSSRGAVLLAFVTPVAMARLTGDMVTRFMRERFGGYMAPKKVFILDELPKIGSGKVDKKALINSFV